MTDTLAVAERSRMCYTEVFLKGNTNSDLSFRKGDDINKPPTTHVSFQTPHPSIEVTGSWTVWVWVSKFNSSHCWGNSTRSHRETVCDRVHVFVVTKNSEGRKTRGRIHTLMKLIKKKPVGASDQRYSLWIIEGSDRSLIFIVYKETYNNTK